MNSIFRFAAAPLIGVVVVLGLVGWGASPYSEQSDSRYFLSGNVESNLTFNDVTLEQADEQGRSVWKVKAERGNLQQTRKLLKFKPTGELFQDGKPVYQIIASREIQQDGKLFSQGSDCSRSQEWLGVAWQ